ncbi:MAG: aspartate aminotransferase family protein [Flavobacteriales bacterium]
MSRAFLNQGLAQTTMHPLDLKVKSARGGYLILEDGTKVLDFISGIGVSSFGHGHPIINAAIQEQINTHLHVMVYGEVHQSSQQRAAKNLLALLPDALDAVYFVNSGAEAIDGAIKLCRRVTGKKRIVSFTGAYHGNTIGALSISANEIRKAPFQPLLDQVSILPWNEPSSIDSIDNETAGVFLETIQGDAGIRIPDVHWIQSLRKACTKKGALLVLDEIQCGMGRSGKPFAFEHFDVVPDILCLGKALGGGMPIGAMVSNVSLMEQLAYAPDLGHITTFGGHPVACAASAAASQLLADVDWEELERIGSRIEVELEGIDVVQEVRRMGLFIAVELQNADQVNQVVKGCLDNGVLLFYFLSTPQAFRMAPHLNISHEDLELGLDVIKRQLTLLDS